MITRAELPLVMILLLKGLAKAKLAAASIMNAMTDRTASVFIIEEIHVAMAWASWKWRSDVLNGMQTLATKIIWRRAHHTRDAEQFRATIAA